MNEELANALTELANKFGIAIDWTSQNALPYVQELMNRIVKFEIATSIMWLVIGLIFIISVHWMIKLVKIFQQKNKEQPYEVWDMWAGITIVLTIFFFIIGVCIIFQQVYDFIQCGILPEVVVLRYLGMVGK
jgi:uncharacterized membrane protein YidH (DUF202 family)